MLLKCIAQYPSERSCTFTRIHFRYDVHVCNDIIPIGGSKWCGASSSMAANGFRLHEIKKECIRRSSYAAVSQLDGSVRVWLVQVHKIHTSTCTIQSHASVNVH